MSNPLNLHLKLYLFGIFLLPFEGLPFKISQGWNAVAYFPFLAASLLIFISDPTSITRVFSQVNSNSLRRLYLLTCFLVPLTLLAYFVTGMVNWSDVIRGLFPLILGLTFLFLTAYCLLVSRLNPASVLFVLFASYSFAFIVGLIQFFSLNIPFVDLLTASSRSGGRVEVSRVSFMFSEPSFVAVHISGVLLPFVILLAKRRSQLLILTLLVLLFVILNFLSGSSLRVLFDILLLFIALSTQTDLLRSVSSSLRQFFLRPVVIYGIFLLTLFSLFYLIFSTFFYYDAFNLDNIAENIKYFEMRIVSTFSDSDITRNSDPSASIRLLRMDLVFRTIFECPDSPWLASYIGVGFSNLSSLTSQACDTVFSKYSQSIGWFSEYQSLLSDSAVRTVFSMPARLFGEFGLFGIIALLYFLFPRTHKQRLIATSTTVALLGFDSYAFYGFWIYMYTFLFCSASD